MMRVRTTSMSRGREVLKYHYYPHDVRDLFNDIKKTLMKEKKIII